MKKALRIETNGNCHYIEISGSLESMQREVGGWIQGMYPNDDSFTAYCNEEGKILVPPMPPNPVATAFLQSKGAVDRRDIVCGPVFIMGPADNEGYDTDCSPDLIKEVINSIG